MPICPSNGTMRSSPSARFALEGLEGLKVSSMSFRMRCRPSCMADQTTGGFEVLNPKVCPSEEKKTSCRLYTFYASDVKWTTSLCSKQFCWILIVLRAQWGLTDPPDFSINGLWVHWCIISMVNLRYPAKKENRSSQSFYKYLDVSIISADILWIMAAD